MKLTIENINQFKNSTESNLISAACDYIISEWEHYETKEKIIEDIVIDNKIPKILMNPIQGSEFFLKHQEEILDIANSIGMPFKDYFGQLWDERDPLARNEQNRWLLSKYSFEVVLYEMGLTFEARVF